MKDMMSYKGYYGSVYIDGERITIGAMVHTLTGYSAHADQRGLIEWVESIRERPEEIMLVHGEPGTQKALGDKLGTLGYRLRN